jgi:ABC-type lipoprotein release transport system permease subunit
MFTQLGWYSALLVVAAVVGALVLLARLGRVPLLYNLRNLFVRWRTSFSTTMAFTGVIGLFIVMLAFVQGFMRMTVGSGHPANIMVLSRGATDELVSTITARDASTDLAYQPGIIRDEKGRPLCSREVYVVLNQLLSESPNGETKRRLVQLRGVEDAALAAAVHGMGALSAGEWFSTAGVRTLPAGEKGGPSAYAIEAVLGSGIARQWHLGVGDLFEIGPRTWIVTGILPAGGSTFDSEVWAKHQQVAQAFGKDHSFTSILLRTKDANAARAVAEDLNRNFKQAAFHLLPETEYYATLAKTSDGFLIAVYVVAVIIAIGGVLGVMNTMFAAVAARRKDIAMLRILGFARWQVLLSFMIEALLLSLVGGSLGCMLGSLSHGWTANSLIGNRNMAFTLNVDQWTLSAALVFTLGMGAVGGLLPAVSTSRVRPLEALRAG